LSLLSRFVAANRRWCRAIDQRFPGFAHFDDSWVDLQQRLEESLESQPKRVLEVGGSWRPMLARGSGYELVGLDVDDSPKCPAAYDEYLLQSIEKRIETGGFDLIVSKTLLEHVPDNRASFESMHDALLVGGVMHHMIPCKNHPYSWILRLVGPRLQGVLLRALHSENADLTGYPTHFDHCSVAELRRLLDETGFELVDIRSYYAASDYFRFLVPLYLAERSFEKLCERMGWTRFAALVVLTARRRAA